MEFDTSGQEDLSVVSEPRAEYLHRPSDRRLGNESYYFDLVGEELRVMTRLGFQPYERRANAWFYVLYDGSVYWFREENIRIEDVFGLHVDAGGFEQSYEIVEPHERWRLTAAGTVEVADTVEGIFEGGERQGTLEAEIEFFDPVYPSLHMDMFMETQTHYEHVGHYGGTVTVDGEQVEVSGRGYRDHSWGWWRDWTPGKFGHVACFAYFETGDNFVLIAPTKPDDSILRVFGYHADSAGARRIRDATFEFDDDRDRSERGLGWARGDIRGEISYGLEFEDGSEQLSCTPIHNIPIGFEDRNWALSDPDAPWMQTLLNKIPATFEWNGHRGVGWAEDNLPI